MKKPPKEGKKRVATRVIALTLCILLAGSAVVAALMSVAYAEEMGSTQLSLYVEEGLLGVRAEQTTRYVNETGRPLTSVLFSLQANALRRNWTTPSLDGDSLGAYPDGFNPGGAELYLVQVDGEDAAWGVQGESESIVYVACDLAAGEAVTFTFGYEVLLPSADGFLGVGDVGWRLTFFYLAPVYFDDALERFSPVAVGSIASAIHFAPQDFHLTIDAPTNYLVATGGETTTEIERADGRTVTRAELTGARSAAVALSRRYTRYEGDADGMAVAVYTLHRTKAGQVIDIARRASAFFAGLIGDTPRRTMTFVETDAPGVDDVHDGIALLDEALFAHGQDDALEKAVVSAIAWQYFGGAVSSDPAREPWLCDTLGWYLMLLYYEDTYGNDRYAEEMEKNSRDALDITLPGRLTVDSYAQEFSSRADYEAVILGRGAVSMHDMRRSVGRDAFSKALGQYYAANKGGVASIADFAAALSSAAGRDVDLMLMGALTEVRRAGENIDWSE